MCLYIWPLVFLDRLVCFLSCVQNIFLLSHPNTHTHWSTREHQTLSLTFLFLAGSGGRERGVTGSLTNQALPAVIGVQEVVEAAGYNWTAARNLCGWLSKPSLPFSPAISITPLVQVSSLLGHWHSNLNFSPKSVLLCVCVVPVYVCMLVVAVGRGVMRTQSSSGPWRHRENG